MTTFAVHLRRLREDRGLLQVEVAKRIGVRQPYYAKLEAGTKAPTVERVRLLLKALEVKDVRTFVRLAVLAGVPKDWHRHFGGRHL